MSSFRISTVCVAVPLVMVLGIGSASAESSTPPGRSWLERACEAALDGMARSVGQARELKRDFEIRHAEEISRLRLQAAAKYVEMRGAWRARWDQIVRDAPPQVAADLRRFARVWTDSTTSEIKLRGFRFEAPTSSVLDMVRASFGRGGKRARANVVALAAMNPIGAIVSALGGPGIYVDNGIAEYIARRAIATHAPYLVQADGVAVLQVGSPTLLFVAGRSLPQWFFKGETIIVHGHLVHAHMRSGWTSHTGDL